MEHSYEALPSPPRPGYQLYFMPALQTQIAVLRHCNQCVEALWQLRFSLPALQHLLSVRGLNEASSVGHPLRPTGGVRDRAESTTVGAGINLLVS